MASIKKEILVNSSAQDVWEVIGDFEAGPSRMTPGYVVDTRVEGDSRVVTFANGTVTRERFISVDDDARRIAYAIIGDTLKPTHDNASMEVIADGKGRCRFVWIHDLLPDDLAPSFEAAMNEAVSMIKETLESRAGGVRAAAEKPGGRSSSGAGHSR